MPDKGRRTFLQRCAAKAGAGTGASLLLWLEAVCGVSFVCGLI